MRWTKFIIMWWASVLLMTLSVMLILIQCGEYPTIDDTVDTAIWVVAFIGSSLSITVMRDVLQ